MEITNNNGSSGTLQFDEEMCEQYLFGELDETDQERFETAYFTDDAFFERFLAIKTELLDLYTRDELDASRRIRMGSHFLTTAPRQKQVAEFSAFTKAITAIADRQVQHTGSRIASSDNSPVEKAGWIESLVQMFTFPRASVAATLVLAALGVVFYLNGPQPDDKLEQALQQPENLSPRIQPDEPANGVSESQEPRVTEKPRIKGSDVAVHAPLNQKTENRKKNLPRRADEKLPVNERAATGFALTISTVGRDNGRPVGPAPTSGLNFGGQRGRDGTIDLKGKVLDPNGNALQGAVVTARNLTTGVRRSMTSSSDGTYSFAQLPPGKYEIDSNAVTLKRSVISPIELSAAKTYELDISLQPGSADAVVNVSGDTAALGLSSSVTLEARTRDAADSNVLKIYADTAKVNIKLSFSRFDFVSYSVGIETVSGTKIFSAKDITDLKPQSYGGIPMDFDAKRFKARDYIVKLSGRTKAGISEVINEYYLKVQRLASKTPKEPPNP